MSTDSGSACVSSIFLSSLGSVEKTPRCTPVGAQCSYWYVHIIRLDCRPVMKCGKGHPLGLPRIPRPTGCPLLSPPYFGCYMLYMFRTTEGEGGGGGLNSVAWVAHIALTRGYFCGVTHMPLPNAAPFFMSLLPLMTRSPVLRIEWKFSGLDPWYATV